jgi:hypothetical protein
LANDSIVPLYIVDGLYCAFEIATTLQEAKLF